MESVSILIDHTLSHFPVFFYQTCLVSFSDWPGGSNGTVGWSVVQLGHGKVGQVSQVSHMGQVDQVGQVGQVSQFI